MFILTIEGKEREGAYAVADKKGGQILYLFEEEDDAERYAMMLEDDGYPDMNVIEVDEELMIKTCHIHGHEYAVITKNDIVIPPEQHDFI
tara:strand:- start:936 stop:1205 length:270 start_codon:yes stop_codon:yes gene_type:complete